MRGVVSVVYAILLWVGTMMPAAGGTDPVHHQVLILQRKGYTHFLVTRRLLSTEIEAYAPFDSHMHLELANNSGNMLEITVQRISSEKYAHEIYTIHKLSVEKNRQDPSGWVLGTLVQMLASSKPVEADTSGIVFQSPGDDGMDTEKNDQIGDRDAPYQDRNVGDADESDSDHGDQDSRSGDDD